MTTEEEIDSAAQYQGLYKQTFGTPWGQTVLRDLSAFCCANISCIATRPDGSVDVNETVRNEGRRDVFLRIQRALNLTPEELIHLARGRTAGLLGATDGE